MHLSYKPRSLEPIYETAKEMGISLNDIEKMLDEMVKNGVIEYLEREGMAAQKEAEQPALFEF